MPQKTPQIFVYDIDREGSVLMHWAEMVGEEIRVVASPCVYPNSFWQSMKRMHVLHDHKLEKEIDNELGEVWVSYVGKGDWEVMRHAINLSVVMMIDERTREREALERLERIVRSN